MRRCTLTTRNTKNIKKHFNMKTLIIILFVLVGCSKHNDPNPVDPVVGHWIGGYPSTFNIDFIISKNKDSYFVTGTYAINGVLGRITTNSSVSLTNTINQWRISLLCDEIILSHPSQLTLYDATLGDNGNMLLITLEDYSPGGNVSFQLVRQKI